jgi:hypothetical protein
VHDDLLRSEVDGEGIILPPLLAQSRAHTA